MAKPAAGELMLISPDSDVIGMETVQISKSAISDLVRVKEEFDMIVQSLELMADGQFMESYRKAKEQIQKREFVDWDAL